MSDRVANEVEWFAQPELWEFPATMAQSIPDAGHEVAASQGETKTDENPARWG